MKKLIAISGLIVALLLPTSSFAQTGIYLDYYQQVSDPDPTWLVAPEWYSNHQWRFNAMFGSPYSDTLINGDASSAAYQATEDAIERWLDMAGWRPQLKFQMVEDDPYAYVQMDDNPCSNPSAFACTGPLTWVNVGSGSSSWNINVHHTWYLRTNPIFEYLTNEEQIRVMVHELGHINGLGHPPSSYWSVMDSNDTFSISDPTTFDRNNVMDFWSDAGPNNGYNWNGGAVTGGGAAWMAWTDWAWADWYIAMDLYAWDGSEWDYYKTLTTTNQVGTHYDIEPRSLHFNITPYAYGMPNNSYILGCAYPKLGADGNGQYTCGASIWYSY